MPICWPKPISKACNISFTAAPNCIWRTSAAQATRSRAALQGRSIFGHWSAHKLEQLTDFELRHGEAVSIGIALDSVYSWLLGMLDEASLHRIIHLLKTLRLPLYHPLLEIEDGESAIVAGLEEFREHLGGRLTISLLRAIGKGEEVHAMDLELLRKAVNMLREKW